MQSIVRIAVLALLQIQIAHAWAEEKLPGPAAVELEISAGKIRELVGKDWKVEVIESGIVAEFGQLVAFADVEINGPAFLSKEEAKAHEAAKQTIKKACRFTLRFDNKLSIQRYEQLRKQNRTIEKQHEALRATVRHISHKFDQYLPHNEEQRQQVADYRRKAKKLVRHDLPDFFSTDHSIRLYRSWSAWEYPHEEDLRTRIEEVEQNFHKLFGVYDPLVTQERTSYGRYLDPSQ